MKHNKLLDSLTQLRVQGIVAQESSPSPTFFNIQPTNEFEAILTNFPDVTQPQCGNNPIKHDVTHHIITTGLPVSAHPRRLSPEKLKVAHQEFNHMLQEGIIRPSSSSWSSPLHWSPRRIQVTGAPVGIIVLLTMQPLQTGILYPIYRILLSRYMGLPFSPSWT